MSIYCEETWINATEGYGHGESGIYETFADTSGELYRSFVREHGRCIGKVYIDPPDGESKAIGWVFVKRAKYQDTGKTYLQETWVTLHEKPPTVTREHHYFELKG